MSRDYLYCPHCGKGYVNKGLMTQCVNRCLDKREVQKRKSGLPEAEVRMPFLIPTERLPREMEFCSTTGLHELRCIGKFQKEGFVLEGCEFIR